MPHVSARLYKSIEALWHSLLSVGALWHSLCSCTSPEVSLTFQGL